MSKEQTADLVQALTAAAESANQHPEQGEPAKALAEFLDASLSKVQR